MNRTLAVIAAAVCLGAGAVGCSSGTKATSSSAPSSAAASTPAAAAPGQGCNAPVLKQATQAMDSEKDAMNQELNTAGTGVKITKITSDDSCYLVMETNAKTSDAQAKKEFQSVGQGFAGAIPTSGASAIKGVKIVAADNSVIFEQGASK
ncbi:hypothetical protein NGB36_10585 [Streptomyces sp. RB6PN25]|uniref:Lipoprotein n=1 Tax=Streptomyces humicola TaxID=2953240 RepID=A0ABT1PTN4_9ACTN|nr:hypothetical protein [Streptomyces humicola]MCQ4081034.1 hypothetical protein [Streptomyces humicola]